MKLYWIRSWCLNLSFKKKLTTYFLIGWGTQAKRERLFNTIMWSATANNLNKKRLWWLELSNNASKYWWKRRMPELVRNFFKMSHYLRLLRSPNKILHCQWQSMKTIRIRCCLSLRTTISCAYELQRAYQQYVLSKTTLNREKV